LKVNLNLTLEVGDEFICSARGSGQHVWIEDMILMKNLSQTLLLVESQSLYRYYKDDDLGGIIESFDEVYK
jgi:hypothetical protein